MVRQRSPQLAQIRFLRFRTCESPLHGSQTPETLFTAHSWCVHAPVARSAPSELRDRAILSLFWCFPYWSRWLTPMDFQWDLVDIFEMTNVSGFLFSKKCSNFFLKPNFWSRFFSNICAVWFPVDWACFLINPGLQKSSTGISIFVRGANCNVHPPLWRSLTDQIVDLKIGRKIWFF